MSTQTIMIELSQLEKSPANVRKTVSKSSLSELKASIAAHGLMQNLVVTKTDDETYLVIAGNRRLMALKELQSEGAIANDFQVPCKLYLEHSSVEVGLAENTIREAMHPADEFEAYVNLVEQGQTEEEIAQRFGVDKKHVQQRLKLGKVSPKLIDEYKKGKLDLECLMAFTISDDHDKQFKVYKSLQSWDKNARSIRGKLTDKMIGGDHRLVKFVGLKNYQAAGGKTLSDLFSKDKYLSDSNLLNDLAIKKLTDAAGVIEAEGWGWVEFRLDRDHEVFSGTGRLEAKPTEAPKELIELQRSIEKELQDHQQIESDNEENEDFDWEAHNDKENEIAERQSEVEEQLEKYMAFDSEEMAHAGCFLCVDYNGQIDITRGLVKKEDRKKINRDSEDQADNGDEVKPVKEKKQISDKLALELSNFRLQVAQQALSYDTPLALDLLSYLFYTEICSRYENVGIDIRISKHYSTAPDSMPAAVKFQEYAELLKNQVILGGFKEMDFKTFSNLPTELKGQILAYGVAASVKDQLGIKPSSKILEQVLQMTKVDLSEYWRPTKENYFSKISSKQLIDIGTEIFGEEWRLKNKALKKDDLVELLDQIFKFETEATTEEREKISTWLPAGMAFVGYNAD